MSWPHEHVLRHSRASTLATCDATGSAPPRFCKGRVLRPRLPPGALARTIALADPVMTHIGGWLHFEGCRGSACIDVRPASPCGRIVGRKGALPPRRARGLPTASAGAA